MPKLLIGADVGGTKTAAAVAIGNDVLARAEGPGAAMRPGRAAASAEIITDVVRRALADAGQQHGDVLLVGAAGAGRATEREALAEALRVKQLAACVTVTTDIELALAGAFDDGPGIVVSAGTGSVAVGRDAAGTVHRVGGYGWQMGDEGSGYAIGRAALGAVSRAHDGRSPATVLSDRLIEATGTEDFDGLVRWAAGASAAEVARLAPRVLAVAEEGDPLAQGIADYAARELCQLAFCLLPRMQVEPPVPVAMAGGILGPSAALRRRVFERFREEPSLRPVEAPVDAVMGALRLAGRV